ncbi:hypothetical protein L195_g029538 [Trifolium pratense]|uniref:Uncharacterized protein n=1 Tax=Trifolium pratense TaxID=57577 RepID=A0A2K3L522_TRIPR|nr:hypothetical protein L195_g029538 [Trifolium pratense]
MDHSGDDGNDVQPENKPISFSVKDYAITGPNVPLPMPKHCFASELDPLPSPGTQVLLQNRMILMYLLVDCSESLRNEIHLLGHKA